MFDAFGKVLAGIEENAIQAMPGRYFTWEFTRLKKNIIVSFYAFNPTRVRGQIWGTLKN